MPYKTIKSQQSEVVTIDFPSMQSSELQQRLTSTGRRYQYPTVFFGFGGTEVIIGVFSVLLGIIVTIQSATVKDNRTSRYDGVYCSGARFFSFVCQGIWGGLLLVATGALGIRLSKQPSRGMYIANMTLTIITPITMSVVVIMSAIGAASSTRCSQAIVGLHATIAVACFVAMVITIVHAAFSCNGVCCSEQPVILLTSPPQASNTMMVQESSPSNS